MTLPERFADVQELEEVMSRPSTALVADLERAPGDIMVLGVGGKMGPTLARMAKRAAPKRRVIGVARFSQPGLREQLQAHGVECIAADLLSRDALARLPDTPNIVFMAGRKFGSTGSEWLTWAMNAHVPALVAERFARSRIVAFSTACVYPFVSTAGNGAVEAVPPTAPSGEYANSCVARERMFQHFSHEFQTPGRLLRLS
jgi:nucleoside-diphosphate-sugar epimerase